MIVYVEILEFMHELARYTDKCSMHAIHGLLEVIELCHAGDQLWNVQQFLVLCGNQRSDL